MTVEFTRLDSRYFGYQYATADEWVKVIRNGAYTGDIPLTCCSSLSDVAQVMALEDLFGRTGNPTSQGQYRTDGWIQPINTNGILGFAYLVAETLPSRFGIGQYIDPAVFSPTRDSTSLSNGLIPGSWIFKKNLAAEIPEPSSIALLALGLAAAAFSRKRSGLQR